jgi:amino acid permease
MKKITGITTFLGCSFGMLVSLYFAFDRFERNYEDEAFMLLGLVILFSLGVYYTVVTRFGNSKPTVLDNLDRENEIIKKQIEKRELLAKLEHLERNE